MFCMVFNLLSGARDHPFDKTRAKACRETSARLGQGTSRRPPRVRGGAGRTLCGQHGADRSGVAGRKPNRLRGLSIEGEVPQSGHRGEKPKQKSSAYLIRQWQDRGDGPEKGEKDHRAHTCTLPHRQANTLPRAEIAEQLEHRTAPKHQISTMRPRRRSTANWAVGSDLCPSQPAITAARRRHSRPESCAEKVGLAPDQIGTEFANPIGAATATNMDSAQDQHRTRTEEQRVDLRAKIQS